MNINFTELKLRNFLSFGNVEQVVKLDKNLHTLITGINKDKSTDDEGNVNGIGKSSFMQAIHYALYGKSIGNRITLPNLVNNINKKHMEVSLCFEKDEIQYRIERGRNPNYLHFYKNDEEITDESLGDSRDTQSVIEEIIGMSSDLFCQTVLLSCSVPIFMDESTANQKIIIEKVLGIDIITKKINALKEVIKDTKNEINNEEFRVTTINSQNETTRKNYEEQLATLSSKQSDWNINHTQEIENKEKEINCFNEIDFDKELKLLKQWEEYNKENKENEENKEKVLKLNSNLDEYIKVLNEYNDELKQKEFINFDLNEKAFDYNEKIDAEYKRISDEKDKATARYNELVEGQKQIKSEIDKLENNKKAYENNICPTCGQVLNKDVAEKEIKNIDSSIQQFKDASFTIEKEIIEINSNIRELESKLNDTNAWTKKEPQVEDRYALIKVKSDIESLKSNIKFNENGIKSLQEQIKNITIKDIQKPEKESIFINESVLYETKAHLESLKKDVENLMKETKNPFDETIEQIKTAMESIKDVDSSKLKELQDNQNHNEILLKLLNSPSSYIRQAILDKSLDYLNTKIKYYLNKLGSLHVVTFNNDMSITIKGNGLEYGTVSSGEMGRITIALTFAFRDAWESLSGCSINLLMIDEMVERLGLDVNGKQMLLKAILDKEDKNVFVVTHDSTLSDQIKNKLVIVKERNFSNIQP